MNHSMKESKPYCRLRFSVLPCLISAEFLGSSEVGSSEDEEFGSEDDYDSEEDDLDEEDDPVPTEKRDEFYKLYTKAR